MPNAEWRMPKNAEFRNAKPESAFALRATADKAGSWKPAAGSWLTAGSCI
jgi:hypothetical protein